LQGFGYGHGGRKVTKQMDMIGLNARFVNFKMVSFTNLAQKELDIPAYAGNPHRIFSVFGLPHKVEAVFANGVAKMFQTFHFCCLRTAKMFKAHANLLWDLVRAPSSLRTILYLNRIEKTYGGKDNVLLTWAKAQGIL